MDLLSLLADSGVIDRKQIPTLQHEAGGLSATGATLEDALVRGGVASDAILKAKGEYYQIPTRTLEEAPIPFEILRYVPEESARYYRLAPLAIQDHVLEIGITDPDNLEARDALNFISNKAGMPYKLFLISESDFNKLLEQYKGLS